MTIFGSPDFEDRRHMVRFSRAPGASRQPPVGRRTSNPLSSVRQAPLEELGNVGTVVVDVESVGTAVDDRFVVSLGRQRLRVEVAGATSLSVVFVPVDARGDDGDANFV